VSRQCPTYARHIKAHLAYNPIDRLAFKPTYNLHLMCTLDVLRCSWFELLYGRCKPMGSRLLHRGQPTSAENSIFSKGRTKGNTIFPSPTA